MKDFELLPGTRFLKVVGKGGILKDPKVIFESPEYMWTDLRNSTFKIEGNAEIGCSLARQIVSLVREEDSNVEERLRKEFGVDCAIETLKQMRMRRGRTIELRRPLSAGTENDMHHLHIRQIAVYDTNGKQLELTMDSASKTETNRGPFNAIDGSEKTMTESSPDDKNDLFLRYRIESTTTCVAKVVVHNRTDSNLGNRLLNSILTLADRDSSRSFVIKSSGPLLEWIVPHNTYDVMLDDGRTLTASRTKLRLPVRDLFNTSTLKEGSSVEIMLENETCMKAKILRIQSSEKIEEKKNFSGGEKEEEVEEEKSNEDEELKEPKDIVLRPGMKIECLDTIGKWCRAEIVSLPSDTFVKVRKVFSKC